MIERRLAVGGTHVFEGPPPCRLLRAEPEGAVGDLGWPDMLALEARREGIAEVTCGSETLKLKIVTPARLTIKVANEEKPAGVPLLEAFKVQALLYDHQGEELEIGKFTTLEWTSADNFQIANDRSSGEFGFCDTCYGMYSFRATKPGKGWLSARLGALQGKLTIAIGEIKQ